MSTKGAAVRMAAVVGLGLLSLAGCGGDDDGTVAEDATDDTEVPADVTDEVTTDDDHADDQVDDVAEGACALVDDATIGAVLGDEFDAVDYDEGDDSNICVWTAANGDDVSVRLVVVSDQVDPRQPQLDDVVLDGLGDAAVQRSYGSIFVLVDDHVLEVAAHLGGDPTPAPPPTEVENVVTTAIASLRGA